MVNAWSPIRWIVGRRQDEAVSEATEARDPLWDSSALHRELTDATERVVWLRTQLNVAHAELNEAQASNDQTRAGVARTRFEADLAALEVALTIQQYEAGRLQHLDLQSMNQEVQALAKQSTRTGEAMVSWTKVLAGATVVLAIVTVALIFATLRG